MFINNFDPVAFNIFFIEIRWYSLSYIFGIIFAWLYCKNFLIRDTKISFLFDNLLTYLIIGIILGGRLGYIFFYNFKYYMENLLEIFMIWQGGMSFHGGLIGLILATIIFSKKNDINKYKFLDLVSLSAPIGIFLGRIANFLNSELIGKETSLPWAVIFERIDDLPRHPSQIYEAIFEGILLFLILNIFCKKYLSKSPGLVSSLFIIFYSIFRFCIEFTRMPDFQIGYLFLGLTMGQILSILFFIFGLTLLFKKKHEPY